MSEKNSKAAFEAPETKDTGVAHATTDASEDTCFHPHSKVLGPPCHGQCLGSQSHPWECPFSVASSGCCRTCSSLEGGDRLKLTESVCVSWS